jgi:hypothetical protein
MSLGDYQSGTATFRQVLGLVEKLHGEKYLVGSTCAFFGIGLIDQRDPALFDEVVALSLRCIATVPATAAAAGIARLNLARVNAMRGNLDEAEQCARLGLQILRIEPAVSPLAFAVLARILLQAGRAEQAAEVCREGLDVLGAVGTCSTEVELLYTAAEVAHAVFDTAAARARVADAAARLLRSAERISEPAAKERYLTAVPLHRELRSRLLEWLGEPAPRSLLL